MQPMGIRVGDCHGRVVGQLPFHTECGLYDVRRAQRRANLLDRLLRLKCGYYRNRWNGGEEIRIRNHVLLLHYPVIARGGERVLSQSSAEPQEMLAVSNRSVVLQFKTVLRG